MRKPLTHLVDKYRFKLLLAFTLVFLVLPEYFKGSPLFDFVVFISLSFVFVQSVQVTSGKSKRKKFTVASVLIALFLVWFRVLESNIAALNYTTFFFITGLFIYIIVNLFRFINNSTRITSDVITVSIVIYLFFGVVGGCLAFLFQNMYPGAYNFPATIPDPTLTDMIYYSYVTMTTLGYGDITPARGESQNLAFMLAITGQLYVAIAIAFLVGKYLSHQQDLKRDAEEKKLDEKGK